MIVYARKETGGFYRVSVYYVNGGIPLVTYSEVSSVYIDDKPVAEDEVVVSASIVKYFREKKEVRVYTKPV